MGVFGTTKMKLFVGEDKIKKAYLGTEKIYSAGSTVTYYVDSNTSYTEEVDSDASCLNPTAFTPSKSGWTFVGWRENTTASSSVLSSKIMGDEPISLYAVFSKPVTVYTYDGHVNDNDGEPWTQSGTVYYNNGNVLGASIEAYGCDGVYSNFRGYAQFNSIDEIEDNIYPSYSPDVYEADELNVTQDIYLVALYSQTITLTYYNNSTTKSTTTGTKYIEMYNDDATNPTFTISQASKSGWTARGWATGTAGNASVAYSSINNTTFSSNKTLYGLYYKTCTLTAKSYNSTQTATGTAYYNSAGNTTNATCIVPTAASYSGWTFRGWSHDGVTTANATAAYANSATYTLGTGNATVYGLYSQTIYLYYNGNGSTSGSVSTQSGTRYYNAYGNTSNPSFTLASNGYSRSGYTFTGWDLGGTIYSAGATVTMTNSATLYAQWAQTVTNFSHNAGVQSYTAPVSGTYKLEVWGARGGQNANGAGGNYGGNGGYAYGNVALTAGQVIYICCGGYVDHTTGIYSNYNGGGASSAWGGPGGGATHIATTNRGVLSNYASYKSEVLIVAGGGGGSGNYDVRYDDDGDVEDEWYGTGGAGGGTTGAKGYKYGGSGGTQTAGGTGLVSEHTGSFGRGGSSSYNYGGGGGGGWYGGGGAEENQGGGGGSGYIGGVTSGGMSNGTNAGQGKACITLI